MFPFRSPKFILVVNLSTEYPPLFHWLDKVTPIPKCTKEFHLTVNLNAFEQDWKAHTMDGAMKATMCHPNSLELLILSFERIRSRIMNNGRPLISYRLLFMILFKVFYNLPTNTKVRIVGLETFAQTPFKAETPIADPYDYFRLVVAFFHHRRKVNGYSEISSNHSFVFTNTPAENMTFAQSTWVSSPGINADLTNVDNPADWSIYNNAMRSGTASYSRNKRDPISIQHSV